MILSNLHFTRHEEVKIIKTMHFLEGLIGSLLKEYNLLIEKAIFSNII
jgi:hypothetical protein